MKASLSIVFWEACSLKNFEEDLDPKPDLILIFTNTFRMINSGCDKLDAICSGGLQVLPAGLQELD